MAKKLILFVDDDVNDYDTRAWQRRYVRLFHDCKRNFLHCAFYIYEKSMVMNLKRMALLVIDMINDFVKNRECALFCPEGEKKIENITRIVDLFHYYGLQVIYVQDSHRINDGDFQMRPVHGVQGTWGAEILEQLKARRQVEDYFIPKRRHSAFSYTDLDLFLREEKIEEVVLVGSWTNVAIRSTASDAFYQAYKVTVISDCCFSQNDEMHQSGLSDIAMFGGITTYQAFKEIVENTDFP